MIGMEDNNPITEVNNDDLKFIPKTFFWMFLGLLTTAIVAFYTYSSELYVQIIFGDMFYGLLILELVVVFLFSLLFKKLSPAVVGFLYFLYAAISGVTFSCIFLAFEINSIVLLFCATAALFGIFAYIGYSTNKDLSGWHKYLFATLLVGIVVSFINLIIRNSMVDIIVDFAMLFVFFGITMYDMNKIKQLSTIPEIDQSKLYIYGAMQLYLDFINIFLRVLSLFGKRRD